MKPIRLRFETSFFVRWLLIAGTALMIVLVPVLIMKSGIWLKLLLLPLPLLPLIILAREWSRAVLLVDDEGVTRHDGKRLLWSDLAEIRRVHYILQNGRRGALNHVDLHFTNGRARILPIVMHNGYEAIRAIEEREVEKNRDGSPATSEPTPFSDKCQQCGDLGDYHRAIQKHGRPEEDTQLPPAVKNLVFVKVVQPGSNRTQELHRCPACDSYFIYQTGYEYLATGSEEDQEIYRLTTAQAMEILEGKSG